MESQLCLRARAGNLNLLRMEKYLDKSKQDRNQSILELVKMVFERVFPENIEIFIKIKMRRLIQFGKIYSVKSLYFFILWRVS